MKNTKKYRLLGAALAGMMTFSAAPQAFAADIPVCSEREKLPAPDGIRAAKVSDSAVKLTWDAVEGASGYNVYVYCGNDKKYESSYTVKGTSCTARYLSGSTVYRFRVAAVVKNNGKTSVQNVSKKLSVRTLLDGPSALSLSAAEDGVLFGWNEIEGANAYRVYIRKGETGSYKKYADVTETKAEITGLPEDETYMFKVASLVKKNGKYKVQGVSQSIQYTVPSAAEKEEALNLMRRNTELTEPADFPKGGISSEKVLSELGITYYEKSGELYEGASVIQAPMLLNGRPTIVMLYFNGDKFFYGTQIMIGEFDFGEITDVLTARNGEPIFSGDIDNGIFGIDTYTSWGDPKTKTVSYAYTTQGMTSYNVLYAKYAPKGFMDRFTDEIKETVFSVLK